MTARDALQAGLKAADEYTARNILHGGVCDFCGSEFDDDEVLWQTTTPLRARWIVIGKDGERAEEMRDYGTTWACCPTCDPIVATGDPAALVAHVGEAGGWAKDGETRDDLLTLYTALFQRNIRRVTLQTVRRRVRTREDALIVFKANMEQATALRQALLVTSEASQLERHTALAASRRVLALYVNCEKLDRDFKLGLFDHEDREELARLRRGSSWLTEAGYQLDRRVRLEARAEARPEEKPMTGTLCANGDGRPARVNDLCKRCAHDAGLIPKGKIT